MLVWWQNVLIGLSAGLSCGLATVVVLKNDLKWLAWRLDRVEKRVEELERTL